MKKVFILGNPRSGTSLLRLMLNAHPNIVAPPESGFLHWWYRKYKSWNIGDSKTINKIEEYVSDVLNSKKIETWNLNKKKLIELIQQKRPENYAELVTCIYIMYARIQKKDMLPSVIIDKNNYYIHNLSDLNLIWSDAYYVYLIRDGRDVACSYLDLVKLNTSSPYKPNLSQNIENIAREWNENNLKVQNFLNGINKKRWVRIRYEDLIFETQKNLEKIIDLLGINFSERMLTYFNFNDEPESTLDWKIKTLAPPDVSNIGKYRDELSKKEIEKFNHIAQKSMKLGKYY